MQGCLRGGEQLGGGGLFDDLAEVGHGDPVGEEFGCGRLEDQVEVLAQRPAVDFPLPDSPIRPTTSPCPVVIETPSTARTVPPPEAAKCRSIGRSDNGGCGRCEDTFRTRRRQPVSGRRCTQGWLTRLATFDEELEGPPRPLMTWRIVPVPPSETVTMLWNRTFGLSGTSKACSAVTAGFELKKQ